MYYTIFGDRKKSQIALAAAAELVTNNHLHIKELYSTSLQLFISMALLLCYVADMSNSIETAIAIAFFGTIAIGIAIAKAIFQLLLLLLILLREFSNYCYCYWYC